MSQIEDITVTDQGYPKKRIVNNDILKVEMIFELKKKSETGSVYNIYIYKNRHMYVSAI